MKKFFYLLTFLYILVSVTNVNAAECTYKELKGLKDLAKKVEIGYYPVISKENIGYIHADLYNLNNKFYFILQNSNYISYKSPTMSLGEFNPGVKIKVVIYASNKTNCEDEKIYTLYEYLPSINKYYTRDECKDFETKKICRKLSDTSELSEEEFISRIKKKESPDKTFLNKLLEFIKNNIMYLAVILIVISIVIVIIVKKKKNKVKVEI